MQPSCRLRQGDAAVTLANLVALAQASGWSRLAMPQTLCHFGHAPSKSMREAPLFVRHRPAAIAARYMGGTIGRSPCLRCAEFGLRVG